MKHFLGCCEEWCAEEHQPLKRQLFLRGHSRRIRIPVIWRSQHRHSNLWEPKAISWYNIRTISNLHPCLDRQFRLRTSFHRSRKMSTPEFRDVPQRTGHYFVHFNGELLHNTTSICWDKSPGSSLPAEPVADRFECHTNNMADDEWARSGETGCVPARRRCCRPPSAAEWEGRATGTQGDVMSAQGCGSAAERGTLLTSLFK